MNQQREIIYGQRKSVLDGEVLKNNYLKMIETVIDGAISLYCGESPHPDNWDFEGLSHYIENELLSRDLLDLKNIDYYDITKESLKEKIMNLTVDAYQMRETELGSELMREVERVILLRVVDEKWMDHIDSMDQLRYGIGMRAYGQRDPVIEYKAEGHEMFMEMIRAIQEDSVKMLLKSRINTGKAPQREKVAEPVTSSKQGDAARPAKTTDKVGRNDPCPCGSGKKYKKCCGA
jgi:preprotein translocase subunit SecA